MKRIGLKPFCVPKISGLLPIVMQLMLLFVHIVALIVRKIIMMRAFVSILLTAYIRFWILCLNCILSCIKYGEEGNSCLFVMFVPNACILISAFVFIFVIVVFVIVSIVALNALSMAILKMKKSKRIFSPLAFFYIAI